ncbi:MAG: hypothetical protein J6U91_06365, partial [Alistipes sp.]|nr:hypothetical protein [Alistipes sp.]
MKRLLGILIAVVLCAVACEKVIEFSCSVVESEATNITTNGVTLEATVNASDYEAIERMGFLVAVSGSDNYDMYPVNKGRIIELEIDDLKPKTSYTYRIFVMAAGENWNLEGGTFRTLEVGGTPEPNVKRVAYAASIGSSDFFNTPPDVLKTLTTERDHISIREPS